MTSQQNAANVNELSFEAALEELETIVREMESGKAPLEDSIQYYERGVALKKYCESKLKDAQSKIEKISISEDGTISTTPFEEQES